MGEMKEVVIIGSSEEQEQDDNHCRTNSLLELESFKYLRVLLVEFDDCTRSIIAALLRKSGYRVVSVTDGAKAWEILKGSPKNIDLVLAEVELPSISGFSLLGMIMEDDVCRNIPVIMMSPCDSVNIVYKCMLRGAADFLVKPVRKNELRNLWQHVWRRHSISSGGQSDEKMGISQKQIEAIDESSSTKGSSHRSPKDNRDYGDKRSNSQSSCTKRNLEEDDTHVKEDSAMLISDDDFEDKSVRLTSEAAASCNPNNYSTSLMQEGQTDARRMSPGNDSTGETQRDDACVEIKPFSRNEEQQQTPFKEAMDLIGSFNTHLITEITRSKEMENSTVNNNTWSAQGLELSLKSSNFNANEIQGVAEIQTINHSNASAFSRYNQRTLYRPVCSEKIERATLTCSKLDDTINNTAENPQHGAISATLPSTGFDGGVYSGYGAAWPKLAYASAGPLPQQSPKSATQQETIFHMYSPDQSNVKTHDHQQYNHKYTDGIVHHQRHNVESLDDSRRFSVPAQSFTSSLCNSSSSNFNSSGCGSVCDGSNGNETAALPTGVTKEHGNDMGALIADKVNGSDTHCSSQREAALHKFRLKRKDRCFDKKVRYQSRKKLAEQRPRVKGQFVRQIPS